MLYYFAHPLTYLTPEGKRLEAVEELRVKTCVGRTARLMAMGLNVFSPIVHSWPVQEYLGHRAECQLPWYELDMEVLERTRWDGIILAPGWEKSEGCRLKLAWFEARLREAVEGLRGIVDCSVCGQANRKVVHQALRNCVGRAQSLLARLEDGE